MKTFEHAKEAVAEVLATEKLSKYALAKALRITPSMINRYEAGHAMSSTVAKRLETLFNVKVKYTREVGRGKQK